MLSRRHLQASREARQPPLYSAAKSRQEFLACQTEKFWHEEKVWHQKYCKNISVIIFAICVPMRLYGEKEK
jgi:hypothetical protein